MSAESWPTPHGDGWGRLLFKLFVVLTVLDARRACVSLKSWFLAEGDPGAGHGLKILLTVEILSRRPHGLAVLYNSRALSPFFRGDVWVTFT